METARCDFCQAEVPRIELEFDPCTRCGGDGFGEFQDAEGVCVDCGGSGGDLLCDRCRGGDDAN